MAALPMGLSFKILRQNKNLLDFSKEVTFDVSTLGVSVFLDVQRSFPASLIQRRSAPRSRQINPFQRLFY